MSTAIKENSSLKIKQAYGFIVLNPVAGDGNPERVRSLLEKQLDGDQYDIYETTGEEKLDDVVREAIQIDKYEWVAAVGGDGTVSIVADALVNSDIPLVIVPGGTSNAIASELNISQDIDEALTQLTASSTVRSIDGLKVDEEYYFLRLGIGLGSQTLEKTEREQKNSLGPVAYGWTALKETLTADQYSLTISVDGQTQEVEALLVAVTNASTIGLADLQWSDKVKPDDGRIDIVILRGSSVAEYVQALQAFAQGTPEDCDYISFLAAEEEIIIDSQQELPVHGDGEPLKDISLPMTIKVVPQALKVLIPAERSGE